MQPNPGLYKLYNYTSSTEFAQEQDIAVKTTLKPELFVTAVNSFL